MAARDINRETYSLAHIEKERRLEVVERKITGGKYRWGESEWASLSRPRQKFTGNSGVKCKILSVRFTVSEHISPLESLPPLSVEESTLLFYTSASSPWPYERQRCRRRSNFWWAHGEKFQYFSLAAQRVAERKRGARKLETMTCIIMYTLNAKIIL